MVGFLTRRGRRPLWVLLSFVLAVGIGVTLRVAAHAREEATAEAANEARLAAQTKLAPLLEPRDLTAPVVGDRAEELGTALESALVSAGPVDEVRIYSSAGRILYAEDPAIVGTRPSYVRDITFEVANGKARSWIRGGLLQTHVPIRLTPGGAVVVAEMSQPLGPVVVEGSAPWYRLAMVLGALLLVATGMAVAASRWSALAPAVRSRDQDPASRTSRARRSDAANGPVYANPGFRAVEERRQEAERRATAAEENLQAVQGQLREALDQIKEMDGKLTMTETQTTQNDGELQALRDQLRVTAERLHLAELDNNALRERLALRQHELEEADGRLLTVWADGQPADMRSRPEAAERRAAEMAEAMQKLEAELDYTKSRFHMSMLTAALREFANDDDIQIEDGSVIVRRSSLQPGKVW